MLEQLLTELLWLLLPAKFPWSHPPPPTLQKRGGSPIPAQQGRASLSENASAGTTRAECSRNTRLPPQQGRQGSPHARKRASNRQTAAECVFSAPRRRLCRCRRPLQTCSFLPLSALPQLSHPPVLSAQVATHVINQAHQKNTFG